MGTPRFDWGIYLFCDSEDSHALFDCKVLRAQVQSLPNMVSFGLKGKLYEEVNVWPPACVLQPPS